MLRSRGISQICHTYSEDMHPIYPPLPWLHTPRLRLGVTTVAEDIWVHILLLGVVYPIQSFVLELCLVLLTWNAIAAFSEESVAKLVHRVLLLYLVVSSALEH